MIHSAQPNLTKSRLYATVLAMAAMPLFGVPAMQAGTAPRIDLTRTEVQLHTEEYWVNTLPAQDPQLASYQVNTRLQLLGSPEACQAVPRPVNCCT